MVFVHGQMAKNTMGNGRITKNMVVEFILGLMEGFIKAIIAMIRSMDTEPMFGQTEGSILESGRTTKDMEKDFMSSTVG